MRYGDLANHGDLMFGKPSTGMALAFALKDMCKSVSVYGIGIHDARGGPTAYKYYKVRMLGGTPGWKAGGHGD